MKSSLMGGIIGLIMGLFQPSFFIYYIIMGIFIGFIVGKRKSKKVKVLDSVDSNEPYTPESNIAGFLTNQIAGTRNQKSTPVSFPACSSTETVSIHVYKDSEESLTDYKTFDFDYTDKTNPLLERELFGQLEKVLQAHKLMRDKKNPQITISMNFFIGKKEQYTPPTTITSTKLMYDWNFASFGGSYGGFSSTIPITSSTTTPGYTTTSYYSNIRLNFLNHAKLVKGAKPEIPPLIWMGEADSQGPNPDIRGVAPTMFSELIGEFPNQTNKPDVRSVNHVIYGGLGLGFKTTDWHVINHVETSGVAAEHGIKSGDYLWAINGKSVGNWPSFTHPYGVISANINYPIFYRSTDPYFLDILSNKGDRDVELTIKSAETGKKMKLKMRPRIEDRFVQIDLAIGNITHYSQLANAFGILIAIVILGLFLMFIL